MPRALRLPVGAALAAAGVWLALSPAWVAETLHRPAETIGQRINLRATWGGSVLGLGLAVLALGLAGEGPSRGRRLVAVLVLGSMSGVGLARALGFALDGAPDALQVAWIVAEAALAAGAALYLRRALG